MKLKAPNAPASVTEPYSCSLDMETRLLAKVELGEDEASRGGQVDALKTWVQQQAPHMTCRTDTRFLLGILRTCKFSQMRARDMIQRYLTVTRDNPHWFADIDTQSKRIEQHLDYGYCIPLPVRTKDRCQVVLYRVAAMPTDKGVFSFSDLVRLGMVCGVYTAASEETQVRGHVFIFDCSGAGLKHMTMFKLDDVKKWHQTWQKSLPGRYKKLIFYNGGMFLEFVSNFIKPFLNKKYQERFAVHNTTESLMSDVGPECLPAEYLPDDDACGASNLPLQDIQDTYKKAVQQKDFRDGLLYHTSTHWGIDNSKGITETTASFRKLNVD